MPNSDPPLPATEPDPRVPLLLLAARLRSHGAGPAALLSALETEVATHLTPPFSAAQIEYLAASMASQAPGLVVGALEKELQAAGLLPSPLL